MQRLILSGVVVAALATAAIGSGVFGSQARSMLENSSPLLAHAKPPELKRFGSVAAWDKYMRDLKARIEREQHGAALKVYDMAPMESVALPSVSYEPAAPAANPEITNNQTVGVDEGGIVKQIGRYLVVLQDGRVFSAHIGEREGAPLRLADRIDVYRSPAKAADWYDEMLVLGDRILVTAYNYGQNASEITVLRLGPDGRLTREGRFLLSSSDYYSTENYATRLVGENLVFYAPVRVLEVAEGGSWPRIRRAEGDGEADDGNALIGPADVYAPPGRIDFPVIHTLSVCPLRTKVECRTTAFIGASMRELYVSPTDAFLWIGAPDGLPWSIDYGNWRRQLCPEGQSMASGEQSALLYRIPLDGTAIGAVAVDGVPADQFSFDSRNGRFRALLAKEPRGCTESDRPMPLTLLDIPLAAFSRRIGPVAAAAYAPLPAAGSGELENRFVGDWLVYGGRDVWDGMPPDQAGERTPSSLIAVPLLRPQAAVRLPLPHNAIRIERAGSDAVVTGYRDSSGLSLSYVSLAGQPRVAATTILARRFESEGRSHAFNASIGRDGSGLIGIPTSIREWRAGRGWSDSAASDLSFVSVSSGKNLAQAGELIAELDRRKGDYRCEISCIDWYGNSRPIFTSGRIFGLMGTDLVEGRMNDGRISELARVDLTGPVS